MIKQIKEDLNFIGAELISYVPEYDETSSGNWVLVVLFEGVMQVWCMFPEGASTWYLHCDLAYPRHVGCIVGTPLIKGVLAFDARQGEALSSIRRKTTRTLEGLRERSS